MYNTSIHAQQILGATILSVSLTETTDEGITYPLATAMSSSNLLASADEDPLWIYLQQIKDCLSSILADENDVWTLDRKPDGVDGGWRGAGNPGQTERSEDDRA